VNEPDAMAYPVPLIDSALCDGCGLCVRVCPANVLTLSEGKAIVARPAACAYHGYCERICPAQAVTRPFQIIFNRTKDVKR